MFPALEQGWNNALGQAAKVYKNAKLPGQAPLNSDILGSFDMTRNLAGQGVPNLDQLYGVQSGILGNGGMTQGMQDAAGYLTNFANGSYQEDPRLKQAIADRENRAALSTATLMGGGRYGSAGIGAKMGESLGNASNDLMLQSNENSRNRQLQAAGQLGSLATAGAQNQLGWGSLASELNNLRYDGASRLAGIGDFIQSRDQARIDQKANFPKENLNWYTGILGGMGGQGSTTIERKPGPSAASSILGGALGGATMGANIPGLGAGWGGILGAGMGAFL
ncbi:hypothetical protein [Microvirga lotononidis]|nr:hypothetical protein [Microvirga lotononidis]WQO25682.1 hypothetical protein U0023_13240 [Microvirga lotononidis]